MILDKTSRRIIRLMSSTQPNMDDGFYTYDYIADECNISEEGAKKCLAHLEHYDLVKITRINHPAFGSGFIWGYKLTHKGKHFREFVFLDTVELLLKSFLLPVLVSILTALLVSRSPKVTVHIAEPDVFKFVWASEDQFHSDFSKDPLTDQRD